MGRNGTHASRSSLSQRDLAALLTPGHPVMQFQIKDEIEAWARPFVHRDRVGAFIVGVDTGIARQVSLRLPAGLLMRQDGTCFNILDFVELVTPGGVAKAWWRALDFRTAGMA
jgi:hypothetical protein